ncbi:MAG: DUF418 domain-containing protein [Parasphingorhabdus sp.]|uniref:DUF418 domain-containing protein n=1 Tax=Parasphingorhabdus sp. TaxID=2709688 RepID=UPI003267C8DF
MAASQRYLELDALRGFAVIGILAMNIVGFSMPEMAYISPAIYGGTDTPDIISWFLSYLLVDGKMRGLFTFLFGASLMLICDRAAAKGESPAKTHFSRMFWLGLFGLIHYFFIWWGDILFLYAVIGCLAFRMRDFESAKLIKWGVIIYATGFISYSLFTGSLFYLQYAAGLEGSGSEMALEYQKAMAEISPSAASIASDIALYGSGYFNILSHHFGEKWIGPFALVLSNGMETLPFMMFGMALYKNGFLTGEWETKAYRKLAIKTISLGLLLLIPLGIWAVASGFEILITLNAVMSWAMPSRLLMTIGYLALMIMIIQRYANRPILQRVAAAGRVAFSNYLGTSILMTFIFYGWGLGLYGSIGRAELYLFVLGAWALMLLWSKPWLMRFRYGPLEWLWRSLARGQPQPMRLS